MKLTKEQIREAINEIDGVVYQTVKSKALIPPNIDNIITNAMIYLKITNPRPLKIQEKMEDCHLSIHDALIIYAVEKAIINMGKYSVNLKNQTFKSLDGIAFTATLI
jgi:hypothetical protein